MNLKMVFFVSLVATIGFAISANAGSIDDGDTDSIPDVFDNCSAVANGPGEAPNNQVDLDEDGFGNRCDADYDQDGDTDLDDFNAFLADFGNPATGIQDHDADGDTDLDDFNLFLTLFGGPPGPGATAT
jgi:hypothetical protein